MGRLRSRYDYPVRKGKKYRPPSAIKRKRHGKPGREAALTYLAWPRAIFPLSLPNWRGRSSNRRKRTKKEGKEVPASVNTVACSKEGTSDPEKAVRENLRLREPAAS